MINQTVEPASPILSRKRKLSYNISKKVVKKLFSSGGRCDMELLERRKKCEANRLVDEKYIQLTPSSNKYLLIGVHPWQNFKIFVKICQANNQNSVSFDPVTFSDFLEKLPAIVNDIKSTTENIKICDLMNYDVMLVKYNNIAFVPKNDDGEEMIDRSLYISKDTLLFLLLIKDYVKNVIDAYEAKQVKYYCLSFDDLTSDISQKAFNQDIADWGKYIYEHMTNIQFADMDLLSAIFVKYRLSIEYEVRRKIDYMLDYNRFI